MEGIGDVWSVGHVFHNAIQLSELLDLQTAEALRGRAVNSVEIAVFLLELVHLVVDVLHHLESELTVFVDALAVIKLLKLVERGVAERGRRRFEQRLDLVVKPQMAAVEAALAVSQRVGACAHFAQIGVGADVQAADQFEVIIQHLVEIAALLARLGENQRQMQRNRADVPAADKYRLVVLVRRLHAAALEPRRQERTAAHW